MPEEPLAFTYLKEIRQDLKDVKRDLQALNGRTRDGDTRLAVLTTRFEDCQTQHFVQKQVAPPPRVQDRLKDNAGLAGTALVALVLALQIIQLLLKAGG